jgi:GntR family transcriptional regulator, transcriptional repressor for pyruvate dehydrogenase complex
MIGTSSAVPLMGSELARPLRRSSVHLADSAVEVLVGQIKELIDTRNLGVGDPLPSERELCEMFSSSRTTVREAMRILKTYGVVDVRPKVGAVIIDRRMDAVFDLYSFNTLELSRQTFVDTQGFRRLIEVGGIDTLLDRSTAEDIADLRSINDAMHAEDSYSRAAQQDFRFHARLVSILQNRQVDEIYRVMKPVMLKIMENGVSRAKFHGANYNQHAGIVDALEARDRLAFQYRATEHLEMGLALFKEEDA